MSNATPSATGKARTDRLVNAYLDTILHDFRQVRVWEEHAKRTGDDLLTLSLTYKPINELATTNEIWRFDNTRVLDTDVTWDHNNSSFTVSGDDGNQDYFATYTFTFFSNAELINLLNLTVQEVNLASDAGLHVTTYESIEDTPTYWDAPIVFGAAAKAFRRLQTETAFWHNRLIWADGTEGPNLAVASADYYQSLFDKAAVNTKRIRYLAAATDAWLIFRNVGFGFFNPNSPKFRGMVVNRLPRY